MRRKLLYVLLLTMMFTVVALPVVNAQECPCPCPPECRSPGYWKNHPEAWPVDEIEIGGVTYTKDEAIEWMQTPVRGDKTITMFKALVAAKLNELIGCEIDCETEQCIADADEWMATYGPVGSGLRANDPAWQCPGEGLYECLDDSFD